MNIQINWLASYHSKVTMIYISRFNYYNSDNILEVCITDRINLPLNTAVVLILLSRYCLCPLDARGFKKIAEKECGVEYLTFTSSSRT